MNFYLMEGLCLIIFLAAFYFISKTFKVEREKHKEHFLFFDVLKGIAIISVIAIHASDFIPHGALFKDIIWFGLPIFIMESGYLLSLRHEGDKDYKRFYGNLFTRIILIYIIFSLFWRVVDQQALFSLGTLLDILFGRSNGNYYFIPLMLQFYLLFPLLIRLKKYLLKPFMMIAVGVLSFSMHVLDFFLQTPAWNSDPMSLIFFGRYILFFFFGMQMSHYAIFRLDKVKLVWIASLFLLLQLAFSAYYQLFHSLYFYSIAVFFLILLFYKHIPFREYIGEIGKNSLIIYLAHTRVVYNLVGPAVMHMNPITRFIFIVAISLAIGYLISVLFMILYGFILRGSVRLRETLVRYTLKS